jgi:hypothetical protein
MAGYLPEANRSHEEGGPSALYGKLVPHTLLIPASPPVAGQKREMWTLTHAWDPPSSLFYFILLLISSPLLSVCLSIYLSICLSFFISLLGLSHQC